MEFEAAYHACAVGSMADLLNSLEKLILFNGLASACQFSDAVSNGHRGLSSSRRDDGRLLVGSRVICTMHQLRKIISRVESRPWSASFLNAIMAQMQIGHTPGGGVLSWQELGLTYLSSSWTPTAARFITYLNVSGNRLVTIETEVLKALPALTVLDLSRNQLDRLPSDHIWRAERWAKLEVLRVDRNKLKTLPKYMAQLPSLMVFSASHNAIKTVDDTAWHSTHLSDVNLSHNELATVPIGVIQAIKLHRLRLRNNLITDLGKIEHWQCQHLSKLDLSENPLADSSRLLMLATVVPDLEELSLAGTRMQLQSDRFPSLPRLKKLDLTETQRSSLVACAMTKVLPELSVLVQNSSTCSDWPAVFRNATNAHDVLLYQRCLEDGAALNNLVTVTLLGQAGAGKTAVVNAVLGGKTKASEGVSLYTSKPGFLSRMSNQRTLTYALLDFASEEAQYYAMATILPGVPTLYLVVWDMTTGTPGLTHVTQLLKQLKLTHPNAVVQVVVTHMDSWLEGRSQEEQSHYLRVMKHHFAQDLCTPEFPVLLTPVYLTLPSKSATAELRDALYQGSQAVLDGECGLLKLQVPACLTTVFDLLVQLSRERAEDTSFRMVHALDLLKRLPNDVNRSHVGAAIRVLSSWRLIVPWHAGTAMMASPMDESCLRIGQWYAVTNVGVMSSLVDFFGTATASSSGLITVSNLTEQLEDSFGRPTLQLCLAVAQKAGLFAEVGRGLLLIPDKVPAMQERRLPCFKKSNSRRYERYLSPGILSHELWACLQADLLASVGRFLLFGQRDLEQERQRKTRQRRRSSVSSITPPRTRVLPTPAWSPSLALSFASNLETNAAGQTQRSPSVSSFGSEQSSPTTSMQALEQGVMTPGTPGYASPLGSFNLNQSLNLSLVRQSLAKTQLAERLSEAQRLHIAVTALRKAVDAPRIPHVGTPQDELNGDDVQVWSTGLAVALTETAGFRLVKTDEGELQLVVVVPESFQVDDAIYEEDESLSNSSRQKSDSTTSSNHSAVLPDDEYALPANQLDSHEAAGNILTLLIETIASLLSKRLKHPVHLEELVNDAGNAESEVQLVPVADILSRAHLSDSGSESETGSGGSKSWHLTDLALAELTELPDHQLFGHACLLDHSSRSSSQPDMNLGSFGEIKLTSQVQPEQARERANRAGITLLYSNLRDLRHDMVLLQGISHPNLKASDVVVQCQAALPSLSFDFPALGTLQHVLNAACDAQVMMPWPAVHTMISNIASALQYIHSDLGVGLAGFDARDVFVYSLQGVADPMVKLSAARLCRRAISSSSTARLSNVDVEELSSQPKFWNHSPDADSIAADISAYGLLVYVIVTHLQRLTSVNKTENERRLERVITRQRSYLSLRISDVEASSMHAGVATIITDCCHPETSLVTMGDICDRLKSREIMQLRHALELPSEASVRCAVNLPSGITWICCNNQVVVVEPGSLRQSPRIQCGWVCPSPPIASLYFNNKVWISTTQHGILEYEVKSKGPSSCTTIRDVQDSVLAMIYSAVHNLVIVSMSNGTVLFYQADSETYHMPNKAGGAPDKLNAAAFDDPDEGLQLTINISEKAGEAASSLALVSGYGVDDWLWVGSAGRIVALELQRLLTDQQTSPVLTGWRVDRNHRMPNHMSSNVRNSTLTPQRRSQATPIDIPTGLRAAKAAPTASHKQRFQPFTAKSQHPGLSTGKPKTDLSDPEALGHASEGLVTKLIPVGSVVWSMSRRDYLLCAWSKSDLGRCMQAVDITSIIPKAMVRDVGSLYVTALAVTSSGRHLWFGTKDGQLASLRMYTSEPPPDVAAVGIKPSKRVTFASNADDNDDATASPNPHLAASGQLKPLLKSSSRHRRSSEADWNDDVSTSYQSNLSSNSDELNSDLFLGEILLASASVYETGLGPVRLLHVQPDQGTSEVVMTAGEASEDIAQPATPATAQTQATPTVSTASYAATPLSPLIQAPPKSAQSLTSHFSFTPPVSPWPSLTAAAAPAAQSYVSFQMDQHDNVGKLLIWETEN